MLGYLAAEQLGGLPYGRIIGGITGGFLGFLIILGEHYLGKVPLRAISGSLLGLAVGSILAKALIYLVSDIFLQKSAITPYIAFLIYLGFGYLGLVLGWKKSYNLDFRDLKTFFSEPLPSKNYKVLDTSVIIDGRIADISETGFLEGVLIIPQFILKELQHIADSPDPIKRNRGRRGLEILHKIQKRIDTQVEIHDRDFPKIKEIDAKLIELAKTLQAKLITNDFNLSKVAELQGVSVLNVNELANALKPVVLPGEIIEALVLKEGKEFGQGIAYLDDGTMIVIDNAKKFIGKTVSVAVTSVLQTTAGRMIFGQLSNKS
jgi:uncharacterized protein YacL